MLNPGRWSRFRVCVRIRYSHCMTSLSLVKFFPLQRTDRATKERGLYEKTRRQILSIQIEQISLIRHSLYGFWFIFFFVYSAVFVFRCCRLPYLWVCWFRFMFTLVRYSFSSLIDKQLSRKATLMFQDVLLFELFQQTSPNPFLF